MDVMTTHYIPTYIGEAEDPAISQLCQDMAQTLGPETFIHHSHALMTRWCQRPWLRKITVPTQIACGAKNRLCGPKLRRELCDHIPGARFDMIAGAGHLPPLQSSEETTTHIAKIFCAQRF